MGSKNRKKSASKKRAAQARANARDGEPAQTGSSAQPAAAPDVPLDTTGMRGRQIGVTVSMIVAIVGSLVGFGVLGTNVRDSSGGALSADATLLAPAGPAFSIWSVIYLGLIGWTIWQWRTPVAASARHRAAAVPAMGTMLLNAAWILVTQAGWVWVSVLVILALFAACFLTLAAIHDNPNPADEGPLGRALTDGTFGAYLGWVSVATFANVAAAAVGSGAPATGTVAELISVAALAVVVLVAALFARRFAGRAAVGAAMAWGLGWIAYGRFTEGPWSELVGACAMGAAVAALVVSGIMATRGTAPPAEPAN